MRKSTFVKVAVFTVLLILAISLSLNVFADSDYITKQNVTVKELDSEVAGKVVLNGNTSNELIKIMIEKDGNQNWYEVKLTYGQFNEEIFLTEGTGTYKVNVLVNIGGRKYIWGPRFTVNNIEEVNKFLVPGKHIESDNVEIIALAEQLTTGLTTDTEKAHAIYNWVANNVSYDYDKFAKHLNNDFNNTYGALSALYTRIGVCYDYSTLIAAMGRAIGLESKVIKGQGTTGTFTGYHAWNEIYSSEESRWIQMDATFASTSSVNFFDAANFNDTHVMTEEM